MQPGPSWDTARQRGEPGGQQGWEGQCQPWDVPWASQGVLGHPSLSCSLDGLCKGSGAAITMATFPNPRGQQHRAMADVSSFHVIIPCFTFPLQPHEPWQLGTQGSLSHTGRLLHGHKRCFLSGYGGAGAIQWGLGQ